MHALNELKFDIAFIRGGRIGEARNPGPLDSLPFCCPILLHHGGPDCDAAFLPSRISEPASTARGPGDGAGKAEAFSRLSGPTFRSPTCHGLATEIWFARVGRPASTARIPGGGAGKAQACLPEVFALAVLVPCECKNYFDIASTDSCSGGGRNAAPQGRNAANPRLTS